MKTAMVTGTTSGIGKAFTEKFASMGMNVILVARNEVKLKQQLIDLQNQYHISAKYVSCDLTHANAVDLIMEQINHWNVSVDILVNNAGFNKCGLFSETDINDELKMIDLHIRFVTHLTKRILPIMRKNGYGHILNIGSTGSFLSTPSDAVYSATKAYILSFSNALHGECTGTGIKITLLCPGATETEFARKAKIEHTPLFKIAVMKPDKVVKIAYKGMIKGKYLVIPGLYNKLLVFFSRLIPVKITNKLALVMLNNLPLVYKGYRG